MIEPFQDLVPQVHPEAWVHPHAVLLGDVRLARRVSVWPGVVLRGDQGEIVVGEETNLQDGTIAHATGGQSTVYVGPRVTVGHRVLLHGCRIEGDALIGMGAILLDHCVVEPWAFVGAGTLVPPGKRVPSRTLFLGNPGRVVRALTERDIAMIEHGRDEYLRLMADHGART